MIWDLWCGLGGYKFVIKWNKSNFERVDILCKLFGLCRYDGFVDLEYLVFIIIWLGNL